MLQKLQMSCQQYIGLILLASVLLYRACHVLVRYSLLTQLQRVFYMKATAQNKHKATQVAKSWESIGSYPQLPPGQMDIIERPRQLEVNGQTTLTVKCLVHL